MLTVKYVTQPAGGINYMSLFKQALKLGLFTHLDVAVAYATGRGVQALCDTFNRQDRDAWNAMKKRWLIGVDWFRTEPGALRELMGLPDSEVRIHEGRAVMARSGCQPILPFHPKTFLLRGSGVRSVIVGSGNLSLNGLTRGHECGNLVVCRDPVAAEENLMNQQVLNLDKWFRSAWRRADKLDTALLDDYMRQYESVEHMRNPTATEDDAASTERARRVGAGRQAIQSDRLRKLRAATHLWIEAGTLTKNRGPSLPGNQLMMSPMTRVFFGFDAKDVGINTSLGDVAIQYDTIAKPNCTMRFSDNSMDVLTLPVPGSGGPPEYDSQVLLFERLRHGEYRLSLGTKAKTQQWEKRSNAINGAFAMSSGRRWGVF